MEKKLSSFTVRIPEGFDCVLMCEKEGNGVSLYAFSLSLDPEKTDGKTEFEFKFSRKMTDYLYYWSPICRTERNIGPDWKGFDRSFASYSAPVESIYDGNGNNRLTFAVSECEKLVYLKSGVHEENGYLDVYVKIPVLQYTEKTSAEITFRIDERSIPLIDAVSDVARWWENDCGLGAAFVPDIAKDPVYSFWYSFHQDVKDTEIENECKRAKKLGFDVCIIDDGWETSNCNRGFGYTGDWEVCPEKIADMKKLVQNVHGIGMKFVLWFALTFVGYYSKRYPEFENMLIRKLDRQQAGVFDPRYKKVRDYLINTFVGAVKEWDLDGLKLDFIDQWNASPSEAPFKDGMDIVSLSDAVNKFMTDLMTSLRAVKPDIILEFRQNYIGPAMRKYGNMFRVSDCPNDYLSNRVGIIDLRMLMRSSAVHSDMLMWNPDEKPETAALQIISVIFGTMQYSARLDNMTGDTYRMSSFWLNIMKKHKKLLLEGKLSATDPHLSYTTATSVLGDECFSAVYVKDKLITPTDVKTVYIANGAESDRILAELYGTYDVTVNSCTGDVLCSEKKTFGGITALSVPAGGLITLIK